MTQFLRRTGLVAVVVLTLGLTACGSDGDSDGGSGTGSGGDSAAAQEALDVAFTGQMAEPPTTPTTPPAGINLWVVSCGEQAPGCSTPVAAAKEAAETVGWTVKVCDGQLNPDGWGSCVRQATSAGADVIVPVGIDCASIQQPFQEAKDAGVMVVGGGGADCDETGGQALWASEREEVEGLSVEQGFNLMGKLGADWLIGVTDGQAQVLQLVFTDPLWGDWVRQGFEDELASCDGCSIVSTLEFSNNDVVSGQLASKFSTALLQAAKANGVFMPTGAFMTSGIAQAIVSSGRSADLNVITGLGDPSNYDLIRNDSGQDAIVAQPISWGAWGSIDTAIRVLNGEEPLPQGNGYQVLDAAHDLPAEGDDFSAGVDFKSDYQKAWGL